MRVSLRHRQGARPRHFGANRPGCYDPPMARIAHVGIWTADLERLRAFYQTFFGAQASAKYVNPKRQFESYFLSFADGARLEIMRLPALAPAAPAPALGLAQLGINVGSREEVDALTARLRA